MDNFVNLEKSLIVDGNIETTDMTIIPIKVMVNLLCSTNLINEHGAYRMELTSFRESPYYRVYDIVCIIIYHFIPLVIFIVINTYLIVVMVNLLCSTCQSCSLLFRMPSSCRINLALYTATIKYVLITIKITKGIKQFHFILCVQQAICSSDQNYF
jgi:hypothetical protein